MKAPLKRYKEYFTHKKKRFPKVDLAVPITENEAFIQAAKAIKKGYPFETAF